jgi:F0F1-type ATP synthase membrane subunit c/vacuolar-type H+-ATPase subunit K
MNRIGFANNAKRDLYQPLFDSLGKPQNPDDHGVFSTQQLTWNRSRHMRIAKSFLILIAAASLGVGATAPAFAQGDAATGAAASTAKPTKAQRKQARKEARAKKNAELKKLEDAGYNPSRNDPNYPQDLQKAQKKAGEGQPASQ